MKNSEFFIVCSIMLNQDFLVIRDFFNIQKHFIKVSVNRLCAIPVNIQIFVNEFYYLFFASVFRKFFFHQSSKLSNLQPQIKTQGQHLAKPARNRRRPVSSGFNLRNHPASKLKLISLSAQNKYISRF